MRILIAAEIFPPDIGGPATYAEEIARAFLKRGWKVGLICYSDKKEKDQYPFSVMRIIRSSMKRWHAIKYFFYLFCMSIPVDLIYAQGPVSSGKPATIAGRLLGKKVVVKVVGDYAWERARNTYATDKEIDAFQTIEPKGYIATLKIIEKATCKAAHAVIVPSVYLKHLVAGWGIQAEKIHVIYNAVHDATQRDEPPHTKDIILSIGRLVSWKGFPMLIAIMPAILSKHPNARLVILGDGPEKNALEALIQKLSLNGKVIIQKSDSRERDWFLSQSRLFVLNSGYEGFSHTILEAMAARVPVITTSIGGNLELVAHGKNGLLVRYNERDELRDAILALYDDEDLQKKFIRASEKLLGRFRHKRMVHDTEALLTSVCNF